MRVNYQILSLALIICIAFLLLRDGVNVSSSHAVLENIHSRTSIRQYSDKAVSRENLTTLVKAGMAAPTAGNMQPWNFLVIDEKETLKEISKIHTATSPLAGAAAAILVTANMNTYNSRKDFSDRWVPDCSASTQNILLAATSMGIGSVWLGVYPCEERNLNLRKIIDIPENTNILCIVSLGYPSGDVTPKDKWKEEKLSFDTFD